MDKRYLWIGLGVVAIVAILVVALSGGDDDETTETTVASGETTEAPSETTEAPSDTTEAPAEAFRVAVIAPSAQNDLAFTQSMVDAVNVVSGSVDMEIAITDGTIIVEDAASAIRDYADQGYDLVIAHGSQYGGSLVEIAPDFPDVSFAWGTAADTFGLPNVYAYEAASDEGGYVMGVLAAALSESDTVGVVGPVEVGDAKLYVDGFAAGVLGENPGADVKIVYTGSFSDVALASETAQAHATAGADVLTGSAQMVVGAVGVAAENGILWFGTQANQAQLAPEIVVASQVYHWEVVISQIVAQVQAGTLGGEVFVIDLANGGEVIEYNPGYEVPADVVAKADATIAGIIDGSISTGS
ncbi:MAG: BMP family ABC transporter substrate-binding protein [bacterium]|nr:BMP family ABC transporter substrate-binding protein [bacterium]